MTPYTQLAYLALEVPDPDPPIGVTQVASPALGVAQSLAGG